MKQNRQALAMTKSFSFLILRKRKIQTQIESTRESTTEWKLGSNLKRSRSKANRPEGRFPNSEAEGKASVTGLIRETAGESGSRKTDKVVYRGSEWLGNEVRGVQSGNKSCQMG